MTQVAKRASYETERLEALERRVEELEETAARHTSALKLSGHLLNELGQRVKRPLRRVRA